MQHRRQIRHDVDRQHVDERQSNDRISQQHTADHRAQHHEAAAELRLSAPALVPFGQEFRLTAKNVIYRRWPSRGALCLAAYRRMLPTDPEDTPDTGSLRGDALALLTRANDRMASPLGWILRELLADMQSDPERWRELRDLVARAGVGPWLTILARAASRGEVATTALTPRVATVAADLLRSEYALSGGTAVSPDLLTEIVDEVFIPLTTRAPAERRTGG